MRRFFLLVAAIALMVACTESSTDNENNTPNTPQPEKSEISLDATSANFTAEGGEKKILFSTNEAWTAEIVNDRADGWLSVTPTSGAEGNATLTVASHALILNSLLKVLFIVNTSFFNYIIHSSMCPLLLYNFLLFSLLFYLFSGNDNLREERRTKREK